MAKKELKSINIKDIRNPEFLKDLSYPELDKLSDDLALEIIDSVSKNGGHLASSLGAVDATISLCRCFDFTKDKLILDVGHQCYAYKILTGRSLERLRKEDGVSGFQKRDESIYDHYECGHSSTSISAAHGMAVARDLNKEKYDIVSFIGDASVVNGLAMEGLNVLGQDNHKVIIVLNDNDMSISKPVGGLAKSFRKFSTSSVYNRSKHAYKKVMNYTGFGRWIYRWSVSFKNWIKRHLIPLTIFDNMGYSVIGPIDGHNIKAMDKAFLRAKKTDKSVIVIIKTIKGKGYAPSENDTIGKWHGVSCFDKENGSVPIRENLTWSEIYAEEICKVMSYNDKVITLVPATKFGSALKPVFEQFPNRSIDVGIAEEHALVMAAGLAVNRYHPIISIYSTFLQRAYDELSHDLARMNLDATLLIDRAGLVGEDGNTHQGIYDESFIYGIPNTVIAMAANKKQAYDLLQESLKHHGVFAIRYPREEFIDEENKETISFGKWEYVVNKGKKAIVSFGPIIKAIKDLIEKENIEVSLINAIYQKPMDEEMVKNLLHYEKIIIHDAYGVISGFPAQLSKRLLELQYKGEVKILAIPDTFVGQASIKQQQNKFNLSPEQVIKNI